MKLFKIETEFASQQEVYEKIDYETRSKIDNLETVAKRKRNLSIEYNIIENGHLVSYVFANNTGLEVLKTTIDIVGSPNAKLIDVTDKILLNGLDVPETDDFYKVYEKFIIDHLSIDDVLDNISKKGVEKLTGVEKKILQH